MTAPYTIEGWSASFGEWERASDIRYATERAAIDAVESGVGAHDYLRVVDNDNEVVWEQDRRGPSAECLRDAYYEGLMEEDRLNG